MELGDWKATQQNLSIDSRPVIAGRRQNGRGEAFDSLNPASGAVICSVQSTDSDQIDDAARAARHGALAWQATPIHTRSQALMSLADAIEAHGEELSILDSLEMGMPISQALDDILGMAANLRYCASASKKLLDLPENGQAATTFNIAEPHGIVAAITPWNFPLYTAVSKIAPALAMGNAVILKPSEMACLSSLRLGDLAREVGLPDGLLSVVTGAGDVGGQLAAHREIHHLNFTGSTPTGQRIMQAAGSSNLKSLVLECGGKGLQLVLPDVRDFAAWAPLWTASAFWNAGQVCVAGSRLVVPRAYLADITEALRQSLMAWTLGDPLDPATKIGPVASQAHLERIRGAVSQALYQGGRICVGDFSKPDLNGAYMKPVVFDQIEPNMALAQEEIFGPVLALIGYDDIEEAIAIGNGVAFGLSASICTQDVALGRSIANKLRTGSVTILTDPEATAIDDPSLGMEPRGYSGFGAEGGVPGLLSYTRLKLISVAR